VLVLLFGIRHVTLPGVSFLWQRWLALALGGWLAGTGCDRPPPGSNAGSSSSQLSRETAQRAAQLQAREEHMDQTVWAKEILAQQCGRVIEDLWDRLNASTNRFGLLASFPVDEVQLGAWPTARALPHHIELRPSAGPGQTLRGAEWARYLESWAAAGWQIAQTEFRHRQFEIDAAGRPQQSRFEFSAHLVNPGSAERAIVEGDLVVHWGPAATGGPATVAGVDATALTVKTRAGEPALRPILVEEFALPESTAWVDPLIVYDLDGDGTAEVILLAKNRVYHRQTGGKYKPEPL
jgi:hypothetical protein